MSDEGRAALDAKLEAYCEERKQFVRGFVRLVIRQGHGAKCGIIDPRTKEPMSWQARGRQLYGVELFNQVFREELARRSEWDHAESELPAVRGDQGKDGGGGQAAGGGEDERGEDQQQPGVPGAEKPAEARAPG